MDTPGKRGKRTPTPLGDWLKETCKKQGLSQRQVAARTKLSHGTIAGIVNGSHPSARTIEKLAECFAEKGYEYARLALEDKLLVLAGYRTPRSEGQSLNYARLKNAACHLCEPQLTLLMRFAELLTESDRVIISERPAQTHPQS